MVAVAFDSTYDKPIWRTVPAGAATPGAGRPPQPRIATRRARTRAPSSA